MWVFVLIVIIGFAYLARRIDVLIAVSSARTSQTKHEDEFVDAEIGTMSGDEKAWRSEFAQWPDLSWELRDKHARRRAAYRKHYWFRRLRTITFPVFSESQMAWQEMLQDEMDEELQYWAETQHRELHSEVLKHQRAGKDKKEFVLGPVVEKALEELTALPPRLAAGRTASERMLEANLRTFGGQLTVKKALKEYEGVADSTRLALYSIHSVTDLKVKYERRVSSLISECRDEWADYVARAEEMEKLGEIRLR
jgi:hypothetical protein